MRSRRDFVRVAAAVLFGWAAPPAARASTRVYRVAWLRFAATPPGFDPVSDPAVAPMLSSYRERLAELGFVQGRNLDLRAFQGGDVIDTAGRAAILREALAWKPDLILVLGNRSTRLVQQATSTIPIVFAAVGDPVESGLVASMSRPGGNTTGVSEFTVLKLKQLELIREMIPTARRVAIVFDSATEENYMRDELRNAAARVNVLLAEVDAKTEGGLQRALLKAATMKSDAVLTVGRFSDPRYLDHLAAFQVDAKIPVVCDHFLAFERNAAVLWLSEDYRDHFRRAANLTARILAGAKPSETPVDSSVRILLAVNNAIARRIGLTIPPSLLARADRIVE